MAPVEFEKELQKRIRSREVKPRADSWDRIEARLDAEAPAVKRGSVKWKVLAAACVVALLGYFLLQEPSVKIPQTDGVVERPEADKPDLLNKGEQKTDFEVFKSDLPAGVASAQPTDEVEADKRATEKQTAPLVAKNKSEPVKQVDLADQTLEVFPTDVQEEFKSATPDLIAAADDVESKDGLRDSEVDALLTQAMQVADNKGIPTDTVTVNPARLLGEVESELDESFREKVLKKLKTGYNKVRTAVADRTE